MSTTTRVQVTAPMAWWVQVSAAGMPLRAGRKHMIGYGSVDEGCAVTIRAQVRDASGALILRADVQTVQLAVYDTADPTEPVWEQDLGVIETVPTAVQPGPEWWTDGVGYTFAHTIDVSEDVFFEGGRTYRVEYRLALATSPANAAWVKAEIATRPVFSRRQD